MMNPSPSRPKLLFFTVFFMFFSVFAACSIPNLEDSRCTEARINVKKLYSKHFGVEMKPSANNLEDIKQFLTDDLYAKLSTSQTGNVDYFTQTDDYPKAFRLGKCAVVEGSDSVVLQIVLFWRDDDRSDQREVYVSAANVDGNWLVKEVKSEK